MPDTANRRKPCPKPCLKQQFSLSGAVESEIKRLSLRDNIFLNYVAPLIVDTCMGVWILEWLVSYFTGQKQDHITCAVLALTQLGMYFFYDFRNVVFIISTNVLIILIMFMPEISSNVAPAGLESHLYVLHESFKNASASLKDEFYQGPTKTVLDFLKLDVLFRTALLPYVFFYGKNTVKWLSFGFLFADVEDIGGSWSRFKYMRLNISLNILDFQGDDPIRIRCNMRTLNEGGLESIFYDEDDPFVLKKILAEVRDPWGYTENHTADERGSPRLRRRESRPIEETRDLFWKSAYANDSKFKTKRTHIEHIYPFLNVRWLFDVWHTNDEETEKKLVDTKNKLRDQIINKISSLFGDSYVFQDHGHTVTEHQYLFGVTYERQADGRNRKVRILLVRLDQLKKYAEIFESNIKVKNDTNGRADFVAYSQLRLDDLYQMYNAWTRMNDENDKDYNGVLLGTVWIAAPSVPK